MKRNFCALIATGLSPWQLKTYRKWALAQSIDASTRTNYIA